MGNEAWQESTGLTDVAFYIMPWLDLCAASLREWGGGYGRWRGPCGRGRASGGAIRGAGSPEYLRRSQKMSRRSAPPKLGVIDGDNQEFQRGRLPELCG